VFGFRHRDVRPLHQQSRSGEASIFSSSSARRLTNRAAQCAKLSGCGEMLTTIHRDAGALGADRSIPAQPQALCATPVSQASIENIRRFTFSRTSSVVIRIGPVGTSSPLKPAESEGATGFLVVRSGRRSFQPSRSVGKQLSSEYPQRRISDTRVPSCRVLILPSAISSMFAPSIDDPCRAPARWPQVKP